MPPIFLLPQENELKDKFTIDYNKTIGGIVPGQFIHIKYNPTTNILLTESSGSQPKEIKLNHINHALLRDAVNNNLIEIDLKDNTHYLYANCNIATLTFTQGNQTNTIVYTNQSEMIVNQMENTVNTILTLSNKDS